MFNNIVKYQSFYEENDTKVRVKKSYFVFNLCAFFVLAF